MEHVKKREEISKEFTWALEDLYQDQAAWSEDLEKIRKLAQKLYSCKGTLVEGAENLKKALNFYSELNQRFEKAYVYANQLLHQDMANGESQKCSGQVQVLMNQVNEVSAFLEPEILKIPDEKLTEYLADEPFSEYRRFLEEILRTKEHSLSEEKEELLARVSELGRAPSNIYGMFNNADITFQPVKDENGNEQPLTQERYVHYLENKNREIRKEAFTNLYSGYKGFANTIAAVFDANVRQAAFFAKERKYSSSLEAALDGGNIPISVYTNLIRTVEEHQQPMQRYLELRKRLLGVEQLHIAQGQQQHRQHQQHPLLPGGKFPIHHGAVTSSLPVSPVSSPVRSMVRAAFTWPSVLSSSVSAVYTWTDLTRSLAIRS